MQGERIFNYTLVDRIGTGGFGSVWRASHALTGVEVAVKVLHPSDERGLVEALRREALILHELAKAWRAEGRVGSMPFVELVDVGEVRGQPAIIMELLHGRELRVVLDDDRSPWAEERAVDLLRSLLAALAFAHRHRVVHRDIKPDNLYLCDGGVLKVLDLGIAKVQQTRALASTRVVGSARYIAPERFDEVTTPKVDLYAAGLIGWELLAGRPACPHDSPTAAMKWHLFKGAPDVRRARPDCSPWVAEAIAHLTRLSADERTATAEEGLAALAPPPLAPPPSPEPPRPLRSQARPPDEPAPPLEATRWVRVVHEAPPEPPSSEAPRPERRSPEQDLPGPAPERPRRRTPDRSPAVPAALAGVLVVGALVVFIGLVVGGGATVWYLMPPGAEPVEASTRIARMPTAPELLDESAYTVTDSGVKLVDLIRGEGRVAREGSWLAVEITVFGSDGSVAESTLRYDDPQRIHLQETGAWWGVEGLGGMREGGRRQIVVPFEARTPEQEPWLPPDGPAIYQVELLEVREGPSEPPSVPETAWEPLGDGMATFTVVRGTGPPVVDRSVVTLDYAWWHDGSVVQSSFQQQGTAPKMVASERLPKDILDPLLAMRGGGRRWVRLARSELVPAGSDQPVMLYLDVVDVGAARRPPERPPPLVQVQESVSLEGYPYLDLVQGRGPQVVGTRVTYGEVTVWKADTDEAWLTSSYDAPEPLPLMAEGLKQSLGTWLADVVQGARAGTVRQVRLPPGSFPSIGGESDLVALVEVSEVLDGSVRVGAADTSALVAGDPTAVQAVLSSVEGLDGCYQERRRKLPRLAGPVTLDIEVTEGQVRSAIPRAAPPADATVVACLVGQTFSLRFEPEVQGHILWPLVLATE